MRMVTVRKFETDAGLSFPDREDAAKAEFVARVWALLRVAALTRDQEISVCTALSDGIDELDAAIEQFHEDIGR